jgi:hypothetical protein
VGQPEGAAPSAEILGLVRASSRRRRRSGTIFPRRLPGGRRRRGSRRPCVPAANEGAVNGGHCTYGCPVIVFLMAMRLLGVAPADG